MRQENYGSEATVSEANEANSNGYTGTSKAILAIAICQASENFEKGKHNAKGNII